MENQISNIINDMSGVLDIAQMKKLQEVLIARLSITQTEERENDNNSYLEMFLTAKRIEGCSERTLEYYKGTIRTMLNKVNIPVRKMTTEILREYLSQYQNQKSSKRSYFRRKSGTIERWMW